ncbi:MAG TPA: excinuclease ABC subunit UvrA, partial [Bdellovibrionota bacterium]|nr:excinuclease ABC subunit UvrA [Bdellovibrionota bacterium]
MAAPQPRPIRLTRVRQNNLKGVTVEFPARKWTVVTGLSGSGKSSLAFETLYAEGQRRYVESLSTYTRQFLEKMPKPDLDAVENIPPSIALEQRNTVLNSRSSVGTQTEVVDYLRLLFARAGETKCSVCGGEVRKIAPATVLDEALKWFVGKAAAVAAPLPGPGAARPEAKAKKGKTAKTTKKSSKAASGEPDVAAYLRLHHEQGFRRVLWKSGKKGFEAIDLDELAAGGLKLPPKEAFANREVLLVVDRFKLKSDSGSDQDTRSRLLDSIDQALKMGRDTVALVSLDTEEVRSFECRFACIRCSTPHREPEPDLFSFNSPLGACPRCSGFGFNLEIDEAKVVPDPSKTLKNGAIDPLSKPSNEDIQKNLFRFAERHGISIGKRYRELTPAQRKLLWEGDPEDDTFTGIAAFFEHLARKKYKLHVRVFIRRYQSQSLCPECKGARLRPDALNVFVGGRTLPQVLDLSITDALAWATGLKLEGAKAVIARDILEQVRKRLEFLAAVGVEYLTLSRLTRTLSGGEFQRINLATQLGNGLCGTLYVLDEPSIGLHPADTERLIDVLRGLRDQGNTLVVVEHDLEVMKAADWLVELGPGAGRRGGEIMAVGTSEDLQRTQGSLTGKYLGGSFRVERARSPRGPSSRRLKITGCAEHNLQGVTAEFPLERLVVVTGVSGSGKSTLVHKTLYNALARLFRSDGWEALQPGKFDQLYGAENLNGVVLLDQRPIGRSSRSNPATYLKAWDEVRRIYANQSVSLRRGYTPQHFSFNVDGGRGPVCKGEGEITVDMHFMAEIRLPCEECEGRRFKKDVLDVTYRGKSVHQLLETTLDEAYELFRDHPGLARKFQVLRDVGLGYLQVGQSATTLSGGESQR